MSEQGSEAGATDRNRVITFAAVVIVVLVASAVYTVLQLHDARAQRGSAPTVPAASATTLPTHGFIAFRHTSLDNKNGVVALVPLDDPGGPRIFTGVVCDRVYATTKDASCLTTGRGVVTSYSSLELNASWKTVSSQPLPGQPSRTRISPDGSLISSTVFVAGHSYMTVGFSTATEIHTATGTSYGNLERFQLIDASGRHIAPKDRNIWGVTFASDDTTFYATAGYSGHTHLLKGDLAKRTLTVIADDVECPSLSPDGTRIAFKQATDPSGQKGWTPAWMDLSTMKRTILTAETHNVDDQIEWLDDDTILYGLPRDGATGVTDVWSLDLTPGAVPKLLIKDAWSPTVVR